jgi:phage baseplate assembly protein W
VAQDRHLLCDLALELRQQQFRPVYRVGAVLTPGPGGRGHSDDFKIVEGRPNLSQAVILRLLTPRGELEPLGHPDYGSRLHELIGRVNTETTRHLVKLHILESLQAEPRLEPKKTQVKTTPTLGRRDSVDVTLDVTPVGATDRVTIGPITLEL